MLYECGRQNLTEDIIISNNTRSRSIHVVNVQATM